MFDICRRVIIVTWDNIEFLIDIILQHTSYKS